MGSIILWFYIMKEILETKRYEEFVTGVKLAISLVRPKIAVKKRREVTFKNKISALNFYQWDFIIISIHNHRSKPG